MSASSNTGEVLNLAFSSSVSDNTEPSHISENLYSIRNKLQQQYLYQQHLNKLDLNIENIYNNNLDVNLNESAQMYNSAYDEHILFPINSFDLKEANSCLKEVNLRLKFAQIKNIDDEYSDEALHNATTHADNESSTSSLTNSPASSLSSPSLSPCAPHKTSFFNTTFETSTRNANESQLSQSQMQQNAQV